MTIVGLGKRPIRGGTVHDYWDDPSNRWLRPSGTTLMEFEDAASAYTVIEKYRQNGQLRHGQLRDFNDPFIFRSLICSWALVGPKNLCVFLNSALTNGMPYRELRDWLATNCVGEICILSSPKMHRVSFSSEEDYILTKLSFNPL